MLKICGYQRCYQTLFCHNFDHKWNKRKCNTNISISCLSLMIILQKGTALIFDDSWLQSTLLFAWAKNGSIWNAMFQHIQSSRIYIFYSKANTANTLTYWVVSFGTFDKIHQRIMRLFCNYKAKKIIEWKTKIIPSLSSISSSSYRNAQGKCKTFL